MTNVSQRLFQIKANSNWAGIEFGVNRQEVRKLLKQERGSVQASKWDPFVDCLDTPPAELTYRSASGKPLVQVLFNDDTVQYDGKKLVGLPIDQALLVLGVQSFNDTMWMISHPQDEFENGEQIEEGASQVEPRKLLQDGTLWIRSLGLGLTLDNLLVDEVTLRDPTYIPAIGCGPLTEDVLALAIDPAFQQELEESERKRSQTGWATVVNVPWIIRFPIILVAVLVVLIPVLIMIRRYIDWSKATEVQGQVVAVEAGMFPTYVTVEYPLPGGKLVRHDLSANHVPARDLGTVVTLIYLPSDPEHPKTLSQRYDAVMDKALVYPLVMSPMFALFLLKFAFPNQSRRVVV